MDAIKSDIAAAIDKELAAANEKYPLFSSLHEGYAVAKEELEEALEELNEAQRYLEYAWNAIRDNQPEIAMQHIARMGFAAEWAAIESCQLAAMAKKAIDSEKNRK